MKKYIYLSIVGLLISACGGGSDDPETQEPVNEAPSVPTLVTPTDNKLCVDNTVNFQWNASTDVNKDVITYQIQVAKDNTFSQIVKTAEVTTNNTSVVLDKNTAYYWRIKATDSKGLSSTFSPTFKLYTSGEAVVNHLPFAPTLSKPAINSTVNITSTTLEWFGGGDVDPTDIVSYDVYFGTANPPTEKIGNTYATSITVPLESAKEYFWKIVAKDNHGGETVGQVWKFKTN